MPLKEQLTPDFAPWVERGGFTVSTDGARLMVADRVGEVRYFVARVDAEVIVTRGVHAGGETTEFGAAKMVDVERYLSREIGVAVRDAEDHPRIQLPFGEADTAKGFDYVVFADGTSGLRRDTGELLDLFFRDSYAHPAVVFSYFADADPIDVRRSFGDPKGAPLFTAFVTS